MFKKIVLGFLALTALGALFALGYSIFTGEQPAKQISAQSQVISPTIIRSNSLVPVVRPEDCPVHPDINPADPSVRFQPPIPGGNNTKALSKNVLIYLPKVSQKLKDAFGVSIYQIGGFKAATYTLGITVTNQTVPAIPARLQVPTFGCDFTDETKVQSLPMEMITSTLFSWGYEQSFPPFSWQKGTYRQYLACAIVVGKALCLVPEERVNIECEGNASCPSPGNDDYPNHMGMRTIQPAGFWPTYDLWPSQAGRTRGIIPEYCQNVDYYKDFLNPPINPSTDCEKIAEIVKQQLGEVEVIFLQQRQGFITNVKIDMTKP